MTPHDTRRHMPTLLSVMTPFPHQVDIDTPLIEARRRMQAEGIHHLAVTRNGVLESILSARDIRWADQPGHGLDSDYRVGDVCPLRAYIADVHDPLDRILDAMVETHIGAVPVTREGELVGIFTLQDACRLLSAQLKAKHPESPPDTVA